MTRESFIAGWNELQRIYVLWGLLYGLILIELVDGFMIKILKWREVDLVSEVVTKRLAFSGYDVVAYGLAGMTVHWAMTQNRLPWSGAAEVVAALVFWGIFLAYLAGAWFDPDRRYWPEWIQFFRYPPNAALLGGFLAWLCFSQKSPYMLGAP